MAAPVLTALEQFIYVDLTNVLSVLGGLFLWFVFITFALVSKRYSSLFGAKTKWYFLLLAPTGLLIYTLVQAYGYGLRGSITEMEQLFSYSLLTISGILTIAAAEEFLDLTEKLRGGGQELHKLKTRQTFILGTVLVVSSIFPIGLLMGVPPIAILADVGFAAMGMALLRYSFIVKDWVRKMKKPSITSHLLLIGVFAILVFIIAHMTAYSQFVPYLKTNPDAYFGLWNCRTIAFSALAIGGAFASIGGKLFYEMKQLKAY